MAIAAVPTVATAETRQPSAAVSMDGAQKLETKELQDFADREREAVGLEKFEGGDPVIIIGSTALIIGLLVVLIVVLASS